MTKKYREDEQDRRLAELEEHWVILNNEFGCIKEKIGKVETNVSWLVSNHWVIMGASVTALAAGVIDLISRFIK